MSFIFVSLLRSLYDKNMLTSPRTRVRETMVVHLTETFQESQCVVVGLLVYLFSPLSRVPIALIAMLG
jgi:hypothetical protein